jgi:hypothetical protein
LRPLFIVNEQVFTFGVNVQEANGDSTIPSEAKRTGFRIFITVGALIFLAVHLAWPKMGIDNIAIALLVIALVPWLSSIFKSIEVTGLGKVEFLQREVRRLNATVADVRAQANAATENSSFVSGTVNATLNEMGAKQGYNPETVLQHLARRYVEVRNALPRGWKRTAEVTQIFGEMTAAASRVENFDVKASLFSQDEGQRLAAIAYLYAKPDPQRVDDLVACISEDEDKGFNQYWGIKTIQKIIQQTGEISGTNLNKLRKLAAKTPRGTDRAQELSKILGDVYLDQKGFPQV